MALLEHKLEEKEHKCSCWKTTSVENLIKVVYMEELVENTKYDLKIQGEKFIKVEQNINELNKKVSSLEADIND